MGDVHLDEEFAAWLAVQHVGLRGEVVALANLIAERGPSLGRPYVDTLTGSAVTNLKELRVQFRGEPWRVLFAFDPNRSAILLVGGNKRGDKRWYRTQIPVAEARSRRHLRRLTQCGIMAIRLDDFIARLPATKRDSIAARSAELIAEEATLRQLRQARHRSRAEIGARLQIEPADVSQIERRTDLYLRTLRDQIEAMGGRLEVVARFASHAIDLVPLEPRGTDLGPDESGPTLDIGPEAG